MKQYDVYGIGNALVDLEFQVSDDTLASLGVDKGLMTLIEEDRHHELVRQLASIDHKKASGGSAANSVIALAQLGGRGYYSCKVAADDFGDFYLQDMRACNVATNLDNQQREDGHTGKCLVLVTPDADRTMNTYLGITVNLSEAEVDEAAIEQAEYAYMEGYLVASDTGRAAAVKAREIAERANVKTVLTLSDPNMVNFFKDGLLEMAGSNLDLLFCNESEAMMMTETDTAAAAAEKLKQLSRQFAITLGPAGSLIYDGNETFTVPTGKVDVIDTNGAGDMYAGAFLYGLTHGMDYRTAAVLANRAASTIVTWFGPRLPAERTKALLDA